jgi:hypothetical protein
MRHALCCAFILLLLSATTPLNAQKKDNPKDVPPEIPTLPLTYGAPLKTAALLVPGSVLSFPLLCTDDGSVAFQSIAFSMEPGALPQIVVNSVKPESGASPVRFDPGASGLLNVYPSLIAVSPSRLAMMVSAKDPKEKASDKKQTATHSYILLFDRKGSFLRATSLDELNLGWGSGFAIFDSGELLVVASSSISSSGRQWVVMKEDGSDMRALAPDQSETKKPEGKTLYAAMSSLVGHPQITPYRAHLLVSEMNTRGPIYEVSPSGNIKTVELKLPEGETIGQLIPSDGATWKVILGHTNNDSSSPVRFELDKIAEFDPDTGELQRYIDIGKDHYLPSFACEKQGEYLVLHTDLKDGALMVEKASLSH